MCLWPSRVSTAGAQLPAALRLLLKQSARSYSPRWHCLTCLTATTRQLRDSTGSPAPALCCCRIYNEDGAARLSAFVVISEEKSFWQRVKDGVNAFLAWCDRMVRRLPCLPGLGLPVCGNLLVQELPWTACACQGVCVSRYLRACAWAGCPDGRAADVRCCLPGADCHLPGALGGAQDEPA